MKSVYDLKPAFSKALVPVVRRLDSMGVSPNVVTLIALFGSIVVSILVSIFYSQTLVFLIIPLWMFLRMALNNIDGYYAREYNKMTASGFILNELGDVFSDIFLWIPFLLFFKQYFVFVLVMVALSVITEFIGVLGYRYKDRRYDGPFGKSDRALVLGLISIFIAVGMPIVGFVVAYVIAMGLCLLTCVRRVFGVLHAGENWRSEG